LGFNGVSMIPFPNLTAEFKNGKTYVRLSNQELANMLRSAIEQQGQKVANVEVYPDCFVIEISFEDIMENMRKMGLNATFEPTKVSIIVDRSSLIEQFAKQLKGLEVRDEKDHIVLIGNITGQVPPFVNFVNKP